MSIVGEYSDEGKSGKSVEGRPQFKQMLSDIENGKDNVDYVLVFKLSRFGRNAADVLSSLQKMQDYGVNLICVEDGIDSSKDAGKLMISVLSAVAEIERENILVQTMEGRRQKAREGRWNGGFAPYGYQLVNGELIIAEDEAEIIRIIYDKFVNTTMGMAAIAAFLNNSGYKKKLRQNNTIEGFSTSFVKGVLDNPIYCGKLAFGRRKNEKIPGTRNEYHIVKQKDYLLSDGIHEAIISEEMWNQAHRKRQETGVLQVKTHSLEHEHILSGIIKCPVCGSGMYGNVNRKKHPDGGYYKDYFYYACKHRKLVDGHRCTYKRQWNEDRINAAVEEIIRKFVKNPKFEQEIRKQIGSSIDTSELDREYDGLKDRLSQTTGAKNRNDNDPRFVIQNWMRNRNTVEFLAVWEELHNPDFNRVQFEAVRSEAGLNRFVMTPTKWIEQTNAIGIVSKAGRYGGGTYAHSDIAMAFATWISPEFQLYIMKDYRRLKQDENSRLSLDWNLNRALSKVNYRIHTDAVKENLIPPELTPEQIAYTYASEADLLNVALFGQTAKQWKNSNPGKKGNVRDDANLNQLLVLANMESYNAILIEQGKPQSERLILLRNLAIRQMDTLAGINLSAVLECKKIIEAAVKRKLYDNHHFTTL